MEQIVRRNLTIHGIHNYAPHHLVQAVQFLEQSAKLFPFDTIVSKWFPLADVAMAFKEAQTPTNIRIGVLP
jgi:threonine dehydrogenase-like Zn-dependent dehydrogenase